MTKRPTSEEIIQVWDTIESHDSDISTEKLMALTQDIAKCTHDELMDALKQYAEEQEN